VVETAPGGQDGGGVGQHVHATGSFGQATPRGVGRVLVADTGFKTRRAPANELDGAVGLDDADGSVDVLRNDVATVE
jgi:hypothetical protein